MENNMGTVLDFTKAHNEKKKEEKEISNIIEFCENNGLSTSQSINIAEYMFNDEVSLNEDSFDILYTSLVEQGELPCNDDTIAQELVFEYIDRKILK